MGTTENEFGFFSALMHINSSALPFMPAGFDGMIAETLDLAVSCPALGAVNITRALGINAWLYRYVGDWPNEDIGIIRRPAWQGSGVSLVFGTTERVFKIANTPRETSTSLKMREAWSEFVKDPQNGLLKLKWPPYRSKGTCTVIQKPCQN